MGNLKKVLIILGPTATGKTDLALKLAQKLNGELISCDSRQVYKGLDIGTGKMPGSVKNLIKGKGYWEVDGIKINLYDIADPSRQYNVSKFVRDSKTIINKLSKRGKLPILVGGTGLYIKALVEGFDNLSIPINKALRKELEKLTLLQLQERLKILSVEKWESLNNSDKQNPRRLLRSIEIVSMYPYMNTEKIEGLGKKFNILKIGLKAPLQNLYEKVDKHLIHRLNSGMIEEAQKLKEGGLSLKRMKKLGLEYGILADYIAGIVSRENLESIMKGKIHGYVRRQLTFFKKEKNISWFDVTSELYLSEIEKLVKLWYDSGSKSYAKKN